MQEPQAERPAGPVASEHSRAPEPASLLAGHRRVLELVAQERPLLDVLDALTREIEAAAGNGMLASILLADEAGEHLRHGAAPHLPETYNAAIDGIEIGPSVGSCGTAAFRCEPVIVENVALDPLWADFRELAAAHGLAACWSHPILSGQGELLGTFAMYYPEPRAPGPGDLELVDTVTRTAAIAIERHLAAEERERLLEVEREARAEAEGARGMLEMLFAEAPALIGVTRGPEHFYVRANPPYLRIAGDRQILGKPVREAFPELDASFLEMLDRVYRTGEPVSVDEAYAPLDRRGDGTLEDVWFNFTYRPLRGVDGAVDGIYIHAVDVTEQVLARRRHVEAEERLRSAAAAGAVGTWVWDLGVDRIYADERLSAFFGVAPERARDGLPLADYTSAIHDEDRARVEAAIAHALETGEDYEIEYRVLGAEGRERWLLARGRAEHDERGRAVRFPGVVADVTARVEAERRLQVAQRQITAAVSAGRIGIWTWDATSDRLVADELLARLFGLDVEEAARGLPLERVVAAIDPHDRPRVEAAIATALETGGEYDAEFRVRDAAGAVHWIRGRGSVQPGTDGRASGLVGVGIDISADVALRESDERFRIFVAATADAVYRMNADWTVLRHLDGKDFIPDTHEETAGWLEKYIPPDDRDEVRAAIEEAIRTRTTFELEHRVLRLDGTPGWTFSRAIPILDEDGEIAEWFGAAADVTDRKAAELALRDSEAGSERQRRLYEAILANTPDLAYIFDLDHRFIYANEGLLAMWGRTWEEAIGRNCLELGYPEWHAAMHDREIEQVKATKQPIRGEVPFTGTFGERIYDYIFVPVVGPDGEVEAVAGTTRDVTELQERDAERAELLERERRARAEAERRAVAAQALRSIGEGVFLVDADGVVRLWNAGAEAITGIAEEAIVGKRLEQVVPGWRDIAERVPVGTKRRSSPTPQTLPLAVGTRELWLSLSGSRFAGGAVYTFRDVGKERELDQLRADLIATVSHELRTPLAAVYGAAVTLRRPDVSLTPERRGELLEMIETQTNRLAAIVEQTLVASRLESQELPVERKRVDPVGLARDAVRQVAADGVAVELAEAASPDEVVADGDKLVQVLRNLIENAVKYSEHRDRVEVRVDGSERRLRFSVTDHGIGIPAEEQERIFDKFYRVDPTMRSGVGGTGLGLYICRELVRRMDGRIWVESEPGAGSTFAFEIPVDQQA